MIMLLVATSGMAIYKLHCKCLHHEHISIFLEPESCHTPTSSNSCGSTCHCTATKHSHENKSGANCDTHEAFFVKLTADFLHEDDAIIISPLHTKIIDVLFSDLLFQQELYNGNTFNEIINSPPPRVLSGQKKVTLFHQFKFDQYLQLT